MLLLFSQTGEITGARFAIEQEPDLSDSRNVNRGHVFPSILDTLKTLEANPALESFESHAALFVVLLLETQTKSWFFTQLAQVALQVGGKTHRRFVAVNADDFFSMRASHVCTQSFF